MFDTVSFTYPSGVRALRNVSFAVSRGETLAIVGENGAGKTTIAKLICGFFKPTGGTMQIAGADTPNLDVESVRHTTGAIFQDYSKYPWTLRENVLLNGRTGPDADQRIDAAFLRVGIGDHDSLMHAGGYYRELYLTQAGNYVRNGPVNRTHS